MAAFLQLAALDLRAAAGRRLRRDRSICGLRRKILVISFLTVAITGILTITLPFYLSSSSTRSSSTVALANFSVHSSPLTFSGNRSSSLLPYSANSLAEDTVTPRSALPITNFDASEGKSDDLHTNFIYPSNPKNHSTEVKSSEGNMKASAYSETQMHLRSLRPDEALIYAKKEIEDAPLVTNDPDLYAPLFLNVSVFKRWRRRLIFFNIA
ncbi:uncharacterized protein LOC110033696 [Phalaenopsis equestris]|uniref:uncharacterized protein LOC110033696 n=1 Tax=Phalaenopsis equestris TaxID=78828 RepID=UPI0009E482D0|nr:uncharacterized protein LOC110033696 [Phalaenopsis equestris]